MTEAECGCKPGTYENGWQEIRSAKCLAEEREIFLRAIRMTKEEALATLNLRKKAGDRIKNYRIY